MKAISSLLLALLLLLASNAFPQSPQKVNYQTVIRDASGMLVANQMVSIRLSILSGSAGGTLIYSETHSLLTNDFGLVNLQIGTGNIISGTFSSINWGVESHFLRVELDAAGGSNFSLMGTQQLVSVPYALYAEEAGNGGDSDSLNELQSLIKTGNQIQLTKGGGVVTDAVNDADADPANELQTIAKVGSVVTLSNGGGSFSDEVNDADNNASNELQTLYRVGNQFVLSNGGGTVTDDVNDLDNDPYNELQNLSINSNLLSISGGNSVSLSAYTNYWSKLNNDLYYTNGNLMLGSGSPSQLLTVNGHLSINDHIEKYGDPTTYLQLPNGHVKLYAGGVNLLDAYGGTQDYVKLGDGGDVDINLNDDVFVSGYTGFVGIGTNNPQYSLDLNRSIAASFNIKSTGSAYINLDKGYSSARAYLNFRNNGSDKWILGSYDSENFRLLDLSAYPTSYSILEVDASSRGIFLNSSASSSSRLLTLKPGDDYQGGVYVDYNRTGSGPIWGVNVDVDMNSSVTAGAYGLYSNVRREGGATGETIGVYSYASDYQSALFGGRYAYGTKTHAYSGNTIGTTYAYGLYAYAGNADYTYGVYYSGGLAGSGIKSAIVRTTDGPKAVYCQESPGIWFEDFGSGSIVNGQAMLMIPEDYLQTVTISQAHPMKVFISPTDNLGNYWIEKSLDHFIVHAPQSEDGAGFDFRVVAKRSGYEDIRLAAAPASYTDHNLYPKIEDVPIEFRLQWVKMLPQEKQDATWYPYLSAEDIQLLEIEKKARAQ